MSIIEKKTVSELRQFESTFAMKMKNLRYAHHLRQMDVATGLGVSTGTVSKWELGQQLPHRKVAERICTFFAIPMDELLGADMARAVEAWAPDANAGQSSLVDSELRSQVHALKVTAQILLDSITSLEEKIRDRSADAESTPYQEIPASAVLSAGRLAVDAADRKTPDGKTSHEETYTTGDKDMVLTEGAT
ncbi:MAG: helix-turn-helix transcriptional regulator [Clostridia bacterium]|nr:helix-turn-helix transcriptional regulator [Clostridia bacterium]